MEFDLRFSTVLPSRKIRAAAAPLIVFKENPGNPRAF